MVESISQGSGILLGQLHLCLIILAFVLLRFFAYINKDA